MQQEQSSSNYSLLDEEPLTLPHFDDETTVQSARPVVPLHEVKKEALTRQPLLLGLALCLAALVGAVTASFVYSDRSQSEPNPATATLDSTSAPASGFVAPAGEATGAKVDPDGAVNSETDFTAVNKIDEDGESRSGNVRPSRTQTLSVRKEPDKVVAETEVQDRTEQDVSAEQEFLREQRREARRLRRERRVNRNRDELTRIREIFEGTPRP